MGKYERDWAEAAELAVCNGLNGENVDTYTQRVVEAIQQSEPNIRRAEWKGRANYSHGGDIILELASGSKRHCELKFSLESGSGTAKNLGARTFTKKVNENIQGYREYDRACGYQALRYQLIEERIGRTPKSVMDYESILRKLSLTDPSVLTLVADITAPGQVAYAKYAADLLNQHLPRVNQLVQTILPISGTRPDNENMLYCVTKNWMKTSQTTEFYDFKDMDTQVVNIRSSGKSILFCNQHDRTVLKFSVTWKNICQGGATPCFNVFFGNALR
jgi:hypothetical protein